MDNIKKGDVIKCEVTGVTNYGVFVKIEDSDYTGLIHISEISDKFVSNIDKLYIIGDVIDATILDIDNEKKQYKLSVKDLNKKKNKKSITEKGQGFTPLKENLDKWVQERLKELEK